MGNLQGYQLLANGVGVSCPPGALGRFLADAVLLTGLTPITEPVICAEQGIGFVVIAESHISAHVQGDRAFVDVFSCRPFKWAAALRAARETFGGRWDSTYFERSHPPTALSRGVSPDPERHRIWSWCLRVLRGG